MYSAANNHYIEGHGRFLKTFDWQWFSTHTFARDRVTERTVQRQMAYYSDRLKNALAMRCVESEPYMHWVLESGQLGRQHVHALVGGVGGLPIKCKANQKLCTGCGFHAWRAGHSEIHLYDPERAAAFYTSKHILRGAAWDIIGNPKLSTIN